MPNLPRLPEDDFARRKCQNFRVRVASPASTISVGSIVDLEVYGKNIHGEECRPRGDYFQVWLTGPEGLSVSATAVPESRETDSGVSSHAPCLTLRFMDQSSSSMQMAKCMDLF